jgi:hypothetical protein
VLTKLELTYKSNKDIVLDGKEWPSKKLWPTVKEGLNISG